ncbi:MAG: UDP-glucose 4-epimerase GalE [Planctomycetota bacterium]|nr:UDP-glucose 4-epimerase GalE [Planctomycetota bacterium]
MSKVLVTGGLGYIGSHTAVALMELGHEVVIADNLANTSAEVLDGIEAITGSRPTWIEVDLADRSATAAFLSEHQDLDGIIHFAAFKAVGESVEKPLDYYHNNLGSLVNLLEFVKAKPRCAFIFRSSCTVYGQADELPIREDAPVKPAESPYGNTKQVGEEMLRDGASAHGFQAIALRYFNPVGAHPSANIGELPLGVPQNLIPFITQSAAGLRGALKVFGNDYPTRDGTCIRDYIHVVDVAKAHILAMDRLLAGKAEEPLEVYNLGTGTGSTVVEVLEAFKEATGAPLEWDFTERRPGDVVEAYADTEKASRVLGWRAELPLLQSMADAWRWQQSLADR